MGVFDDTGAMVWTLGILAMILAVMVIAVSSLQDSEIDKIGNTITQNQITLINGTAVPLPDVYSTVLNMTNATSVTLIQSDAYTVTNNGLKHLPASVNLDQSNGTYANILVNVTYNRKILGSNSAYNVTQDGVEGVANLTAYFGTMGTLLGVALILAVVIIAFAVLGLRP